MTLPRILRLPAFALAAFCCRDAVAGSYALGMQFESWNGVDLDVSKNPAHKDQMGKLGYNHVEFDVGGITNYYFEEPGLIFGLISGMANSEANEVNARNEALKKNEHVYHWRYAQPAPIPEGRWFRWGYSHAFASGGTRTYPGRSLANGKDTVFKVKDPDLRFDYIRIDANMITAPNIIGSSDFFWMVGSDFSGTSLKIYGKNIPPGDDWSFATMPLNLHLGWQPSFFPWLTMESNVGVDFIDPIAGLFLGFKNYTPYSEFGGRATLGTTWLSIYYDLSHEVDPLWDEGEYNRRYSGLWSVFGARLDLVNLFGMLFAGK